MVRARRAAALALLEIADELAARGVDTEEVVDVGGRGLRLRAALRDQRDRVRDPARTGAGAAPAPVRWNHNSTVNVALRRSPPRPASRTDSNHSTAGRSADGSVAERQAEEKCGTNDCCDES